MFRGSLYPGNFGEEDVVSLLLINSQSMTFLTAHLPFGSSTEAPEHHSSTTKASEAGLPPAGSHLIISDTLNSPAHFVLFHLVLAANAAKRRVIWVDFRTEGRVSWEVGLKKLVSVSSCTIPAAQCVLPAALCFTLSSRGISYGCRATVSGHREPNVIGSPDTRCGEEGKPPWISR